MARVVITAVYTRKEGNLAHYMETEIPKANISDSMVCNTHDPNVLFLPTRLAQLPELPPW